VKWYLTDREGKVAVAEATSQYEAVLQQKLPGESEHRAVESLEASRSIRSRGTCG